jgi:hypothetical protein
MQNMDAGMPRGRRWHVGRGAVALVAAAGAFYGWDTAQQPLGYIAEYGFAGAWIFSLILIVAGALLCVLRSTRRVGMWFCVAGVAGLAAFYSVVVLAHATGHTRWHEWKNAQKLPPAP